MSSFSTEIQSTASTAGETQSIASTEVQKIMPRQTFRGHTDRVTGVVHLHAERQIITCSTDNSLRLWDLESGTQIGEDWRNEEDEAGVWSIALSPNSKTIASGGNDGKVRLWDVETRKVIAKWSGLGHTHVVCALCWSGDGKRVLSGSWDGTAKVWDVESAQTVLTIDTGHDWVNVVVYSPDATKIATGGDDETAVKIWDAKTGELLNTLKHDLMVLSLAWTSDGKKLISDSDPIRIYDTTTWQEIAHLGGDTFYSFSVRQVRPVITLFQNDRLLCTSDNKTVRLWNLDTNLEVGPLLRHEDEVNCAAFSVDGKLLVTGCQNNNVYTWDIYAILKETGLEDLLRPSSDVTARKSVMNSNATRRPPIQARRIPPAFFDGVQNGTQSSAARGTYRSPARSTRAPFFERFSSLFHHSHTNADEASGLQQRPRWSIFSRGPRVVEVAAVIDREVIFTAPPPPEKTQQQTQSPPHGSSTTQPALGANSTAPRPRHPYSPVRLLGHLVLFLCCCTLPQHANRNAQPIQQEGQPQCQVRAQASSSQSHPAAPSTSATPTTLDSTHTIAPGAASA